MTNIFKPFIGPSLIIQPGELAQRSSYNNLTLDDVVSFSETNGEPFSQTQIITLKSHYIDHVYEEAFKMCCGDIERVDEFAKDIADNGDITVKEFVSVFDDIMIVCINTKRVDNNEATKRVLDLLIEVEEFSPGTTVKFGEPITFKWSDINED